MTPTLFWWKKQWDRCFWWVKSLHSWGYGNKNSQNTKVLPFLPLFPRWPCSWAECSEDSLADQRMNERALLKVCCRCQSAGCKLSQPGRHHETTCRVLAWELRLHLAQKSSKLSFFVHKCRSKNQVLGFMLHSHHRQTENSEDCKDNSNCYCHFALCCNLIWISGSVMVEPHTNCMASSAVADSWSLERIY